MILFLAFGDFSYFPSENEYNKAGKSIFFVEETISNMVEKYSGGKTEIWQKQQIVLYKSIPKMIQIRL